VQNPRNLPAGLEFVDNTAEDLVAVVTQMMGELDGEADRVRDRALEEAYFVAAVKHGSYRGRRIGTAFTHEQRKALGFPPGGSQPRAGDPSSSRRAATAS